MLRLALLLFVLAVPTAVARAQTPASAARPSGASVEFFVERSGGGYEVTVNPQFVTVFYLPEKAIRALASNQKDFVITVLKDTVVVRPTKDEPGLTANLNIDMKNLRISVVLRVGKPEEAIAQVIFTRAVEKAELEKKVEAALAPLRAELEAKQKRFGEEVRAAADEAIADAMSRSFVVQDLDATARDDANVVVRVPRTVRIGDSIYVQFSIQNRGSTPYLLRETTAVQDGRPVGGRTSFQPRDGALGKVAPGERGRGVLVIPTTSLAAGKSFDLRLTREPGDKTITVHAL
jgi:hypothetical protein